jgi:hypothetical protein
VLIGRNGELANVSRLVYESDPSKQESVQPSAHHIQGPPAGGGARRVNGQKKHKHAPYWESRAADTNSMRPDEARLILGLTRAECRDPTVIKLVWKQMIKGIHPDKSRRGNATLETQTLNEAKDTLLNCFLDPDEKKRREDDEEHMAREKERAETEARRRAEKERFEQECAELYQKAIDARRERYSRNRRKRLPTARVHKKIDEYKEGKELVEEMQIFFKETFESDSCSKLFVSDIIDLFIKSGGHITVLKTNLFKRHSKRLFLASWPTSVYSMYKNKRCFLHVRVKK